MAVIFSAAELNAIKAKLDGVKSVGQAQAVVRATIQLADRIASEIKQTFLEDSWRTQARKDLASARSAVERDSKAFNNGSPTADVGASWPTLRASVSNLWFLALLTKGQFPPDETTLAQRYAQMLGLMTTNLVDEMANAPVVVVQAAAKTAVAAGKAAVKVAKTVVLPIAELAGQTAGAALGPIKWILFGVLGIAAIAGGGYLLAKKKGLI